MQLAPAGVHPADIDWPQFRFDNDRDGRQHFETVLSKKTIGSAQLSWQALLGNLVDYSSPAVVDGVVYLASQDGYLFAYSAGGCGEEECTTPLWYSTYVAEILSSPAVANGVVYISSQTSYFSNAGKLDAFSASGCGKAQCAPLWQGDAGKVSGGESSPAVGDGLVFVGEADDRLYAFDATGCGEKHCKPLWTGKTGGSIESSPTVHDCVVFIGSDDGNLYAFRAEGCGGKTLCKPLWTGAIGGPAYESSPAVSNGVVYIASPYAFSAFGAGGCGAKTCAPLWQAASDELYFNGSPAIAHGRVYMPLENTIAVYSATGCGQAICQPLWTLYAGGEQADIESSPTVANGVVYAGMNTGEVLAWPADSCGQQECVNIWTGITTEGQIVSSSPTVVNGQIYIGSSDFDDNGWLYVYGLPN
jgi:outer membrane protein assembly factor BamB